MFDPEVILVPLGITLILLGIGGMVSIIKWSNWMFDPRRSERTTSYKRLGRLSGMSQDERLKALEAYRQLASEKLDVVKTAIAMGYSDKELDKLDQRLEQLIGADALRSVIRGEAPLPSKELSERDLEAELRELRQTIQA
jgi:hypothetical protein